MNPRPDGVPDMVNAGEGYKFHVTGLTHDERGYPSMNVETQDRLVKRLLNKLEPLANGEALYEAEGTEGADVVSSPTASPRAWRSARSNWRGSAA